MSFEEDDEIVQDFLVEAGEILEQLGEQLVSLEQTPTDSDLLNAVFRGFHTIKGGASFISLTALVEVCHIAEDSFNQLRQGERAVDAQLMDVMLRVLDTLNDMFDAVRAGNQPEPAEPQLLQDLRALLVGRDAVPVPEEATAPAVEAPPVAEPPPAAAPEAPAAQAAGSEDITDQEFEQLLDALDEESAPVAAPPVEPAPVAPVAEATSPPAAADDDDITEEEFDALLDELHATKKEAAPAAQPAVVADAAAAPPAAVGGDDDITEEEFESLLDELHGSGGPSTAAPAAPSTPAAPAAPSAPAAPAVDAVAAQAQITPVAAEPQAAAAVAATAAPAVAATGAATATAVAPQPIEAANTAPPPAAAKPAAAKEAPERAKAAPKEAPTPAAETTVRVDTKRLDDIMNMVGELVLVRNRLMTLEASMGNEEVSQAASNLDLVTADLQSAVMKTRMQPIKKVFGRFPRVVRDLARSLKKEVSLELQGEETDLDKNLVEALADPLVHLVRNAVDHGIEMPDVREANGKSKNGSVLLAAEQEGDHILLTIKDDGGGMDPDKLRGIAIDKGVLDADAAARLDDKEAFNLIFAPGFSTKEEISDISGRGVGMDVVKTRIVQLNGTIEIDSKIGEGTKLCIKVPLTLAIMPTLMVMLGKQIFALPLVSVSEIFNLDLTETNRVDGQEVIMLRDQPLPLYFLKDWLVHNARNEPHPDRGHVVVVSVGNQKAGFVVEQLIGQEEVVIKPLGKMLQGTKGLSGATITGDGEIALILDVPSLMSAYARKT